MMMEPSKCSAERVAEVIAKDMVELFLNAKFEASQFPVPASVLIDALPQDTLLRIAMYLYENLYRLSIPLGFLLLFLMPRKIPEQQKRNTFRTAIIELCSIRKDFSLRETTEVRETKLELPDIWKEIEVNNYRKALFLIENLNELRIPIYRGWGFDIFFWNGFLYRAYNLGTLKKPEWVYLRVEVKKQPKLNVFGHVKEAEKAERVWVSEGFSLERIVKILEREQRKAEKLENFENKISFVLSQWEEFLGTRIDKEFTVATHAESTSFSKEDKYLVERLKEGTKKYVMRLLEVS